VMMTRKESLAVLQESIVGACCLAKTGRAGGVASFFCRGVSSREKPVRMSPF
jgi:hypothetical protein